MAAVSPEESSCLQRRLWITKCRLLPRLSRFMDHQHRRSLVSRTCRLPCYLVDLAHACAVPPSASRTPVFAASKTPFQQQPSSLRKGFKAKADEEEPNDDVEMLPPPVHFPTRGYAKVDSGTKTAAAANGLGKAPAVPKAMHNPNAPCAVVLARPTEEHQKKWNRNGCPIVDVVVDPLLANKLRDHQKE